MKKQIKKTEAKKLALSDLKKARGGQAAVRARTVLLDNEERTNGGVSKDLP